MYVISVLLIDRKHAIRPYSYPCILTLNFFMSGLLKYVWLSTQCIGENDILYLGCQYTNLYSQLICYMFIETKN